MKNKKILLVTTLFAAQIGISQINTPNNGTIQGNTGTSTNVGIGTTDGAIPNAKLEVLSTSTQLRLANTSTIFSEIQTNSSGHLLFNLSNTTTGRIGFGTTTPAVGFHSNMGPFMISDPTNTTGVVRSMQIVPSRVVNTGMMAGALMISNCNTAGEGLALAPNGSGSLDVKLGAYAYSSSGWKSMWETANVNGLGIMPNLLLAKNGGNVGIGTGATALTAKLEVAGQVKIIDGTQGAGKVLTSDANGLASWATQTGVLSGGTTNYMPKWTSANALSSTSLIYDDGANVGIGTNLPYKKLTVNGDVAFLVNGNNSLEFLGNGQIPSRRGISIDNDPSGKFNFYIHSWQTNASFNFKNALGDVNLMSVLGNGNVGIGNPTPTSHLEVKSGALGTTAGSQVPWTNFSGDAGTGNNDQLKIYHQRVTGGGSNWNSSEIKIQRSVDASNMNFISFRSTNPSWGLGAIVFGNDNTDHMTINNDGKVSIGALKMTGTHSNAMLSVDGKMVAKEIVVTTSNWADYVFAADYKLPNLYEVETYYLANKHLPEIPSEKEVIDNGIDVAEMNKLLLKKIEEMTIMMVQQQKDIDAMKKKLEITK
jgi:hypothetical protein